MSPQIATSSIASTAPRVLILGAGVIGLTLALELDARGFAVTVLDRRSALAQASSAAAGMLAVEDPHNPPALHALAAYSAALYPGFLACLEHRSGHSIPFQTTRTIQHTPAGPVLLAEHSIDPRQLAVALRAAVSATRIALLENIAASTLLETPTSITLYPTLACTADILIHTTGAWTPHAVTPRKGQMLRVALPPALALTEVHRRADVYIVPRTRGPQAGTALIGATEEDAGFDTTTHASALDHLRALAAELLPALADPAAAPLLEAWAGLRPATPDNLPLLGPLPGTARQYIAAGHFRNGILLAPATAQVLADLLQHQTPAVDLTAFDPARFPSTPAQKSR